MLCKHQIEDIKEKYGLPCYVFNEDSFKVNYKHLLTAMRSMYNKYEIAYSYKTNYTPRICSIVKELGGYAEVVSDMEYDIARTVGYDSPHIIYNGPYKGPKLREHLLNDGIVNIDNLNEVERVITIAEEEQHSCLVGIRVNIDVGQSFISRFGIDSDSDDLTIAVEKLKDCEYTSLVGLHCHIGQTRGLDAWKTRTEKMLSLADNYIDGVPHYIDLGSGMFGDMAPEMKAQFSGHVPTYEEYACTTAEIIAEHYLEVSESEKPVFFTEPGTTVDNRYIDLVAEVDSIKRIREKNFAVLNCSIHNLGDVSGSVKLPLAVIENSKDREKYNDIDLVGYTCLERDVPYKNYFGMLGKGDYLLFGNVGGYSNVDKPPFILPQCAMIGISNSETYLIMRRETTEDILSTYELSFDR